VIPIEGPALLLNNVKNAKIDKFFSPDLSTIVQITGTRNGNIQLPESINKQKIKSFVQK
jgi:hypothetical protein